MPELPEVETIKKQLSTVVPFKIQIEKRSKVIDSILHTPEKSLKGKTITSMSRHGKILIFNLDNKEKIISQLGMSGTWRISKSPLEIKHVHLELKSKNGYLSYVDPRRFGHMYYWNEGEWTNYLSKQGIDPTTKEFTLDYLISAVKKYPERIIKVHLLDQKSFAGVGNYMASEICAYAKIRPTRKCKSLTKIELRKLHKAFSDVLSGALKTGGTTFQGGYQDAFGENGGGVANLLVFYQKTCQICKKTPIKKIILAQRGTYFCPNCQK